ncbi:MAG: tyrosine-type recombinase/integrase [Burkholderiales bacterium]
MFPRSPADPEKPRKPSAVSNAFAGRRRNYGLKRKGLSLHSLRHTFATILISKGVNIKLVSIMLGHSDAAITLKIYNARDEERPAPGRQSDGRVLQRGRIAGVKSCARHSSAS